MLDNKNIQWIDDWQVGTSFLGQNLIYHATCASTNTIANELLEAEKLPLGTIIVTDHQYRGRGQRNRTWHSAPYKNLTFSIILYPTFLAADQGFSLNIITTLAIHQVVSQLLSNDFLTIKWPNDMYYQDSKLGGVLIENRISNHRLSATVIGIGLNVNQQCFSWQGPTSLAIACQRTFHLSSLLAKLLEQLEINYLRLAREGSTIFRKAYQERLHRVGKLCSFSDQEGPFMGIIRGVDAAGRLMLERPSGQIAYYQPQTLRFH